MTNLPEISSALILAEARTWIGTPYRHQSRFKGIGCDCLGLVIGVYVNVYGLLPRKPPPYTGSWAEETGQELMLEASREHLIELQSVKEAQPGDVLLFRMFPKRPIKHAAILSTIDPDVDNWKIIHAYSEHSVMETSMITNIGSVCEYAFRFPGVA